MQAKLTILMTLHFIACGNGICTHCSIAIVILAYNLFLSALRISIAIIIVNEWYCILMRKKSQHTNIWQMNSTNNEKIHSRIEEQRSVKKKEENGFKKKICYFVIRNFAGGTVWTRKLSLSMRFTLFDFMNSLWIIFERMLNASSVEI